MLCPPGSSPKAVSNAHHLEMRRKAGRLQPDVTGLGTIDKHWASPTTRCGLQGMMSTLELLPMWRGTEVDTDLYFSGTVKDDDGEWSGGQSIETSAGMTSTFTHT